VILQHVAQGTGRVVVAAALLDANRFGDANLHVIDIAPVPDRLENAVAEPERHDVLDGFFSQIVIDAVDLVLLKDATHPTVEGPRRLEVPPEGLFDDDSAPGPR
jgi:hypothetical protein